MSEKIPTIQDIIRRSVCPRCAVRKVRNGSITVEASLVLPLFFTAMILIASIMNILYVHRQVGAALENTCRTMSAYAYPAAHMAGEILPDGGGEILSAAYAEISVMREVGKDPMVSRLLAEPVNCLESKISGDGADVHLVARYAIRLSLGPFHSGRLVFVQHARMHGWLGYKEDMLSEYSPQGEMVFITAAGTVYHRSRSCAYLNPSVRSISQASLDLQRSDDGSRYYPCEACYNGSADGYITNYGNRYHSDPNCIGLKRTIREVPLSQVEQIMGACSKCGR